MRIYLTKYSTLSTEALHLIEDHAYPQRAHFFPEMFKATKSGLFCTPQRAIERVVTPEMVGYIRGNPVPGKTGFILAGGSQSWNSGGVPVDERYFENSLAYAYRMEILTVTNIFGSRIASQIGATDYTATDASTCASSLKVLMDVRHLINLYGFDRVVVLGFEDTIKNQLLTFFGSSMTTLTKKDDDAGAKPSSFDSVNRGFYLGQGAVLAVFESDRALKDNPSAELLGAYTASEHNANPIGQLEDGQGYTRAILGALGDRSPSEVALIKTHGTGTGMNNKSERAAIEGMFDEFVATSYKPRIGHTMGASGLLETCLLLDSIKKGEIPEIKNRTERDTRFISEPQPVPRGLMLSLAAGMGNVFSAALFNYHDYHKI